MPQIFRIGQYIIFFWSNENKPTEPIHIHIAEHDPRANSTKIWITQTGKTLICNNNSNIPLHDLRKLLRVVEANIDEIKQMWYEYFGEIKYFC